MSKKVLPRIATVSAANEKQNTLHICWEQGGEDIVDLSTIINTFRVYAPLRNAPKLFQCVHVGEYGTDVVWTDEIDMAADTVWRLAQEQSGNTMTAKAMDNCLVPQKLSPYTNKMNKEISESEMNDYANQLNLKRFENAKFSKLFICHLMFLDDTQGGSCHVIDEIEVLEGDKDNSSSKPASKLNGAPLKGLWHKHYVLPQHLRENLRLHWKPQKLDQLVKTVLDPQKSDVVTGEMISNLAHDLVEGGFEKRATKQKLTGEWIVFAKYEQKNYYLTLAKHKEEGQVIFERIKKYCQPEFPFLSKLLLN